MPLDNYGVMEGGTPRLLSASEMAERELAQVEAGKYYVPSMPAYTPPEPAGGGTIDYSPAPAVMPAPLGPEPFPGDEPRL